MCTSLLQGWMSIDDIAFSSSLFSDKVDNTDELNQLQMDACGCMVQGSFLQGWGPRGLSLSSRTQNRGLGL